MSTEVRTIRPVEAPPLVYMWVVWYRDGLALAQFDPRTGEERLWGEVDWERAVKAGWYPIPEGLARLAQAHCTHRLEPRLLPYAEVELDGHREEPYLRRRNSISYTLQGFETRRSCVYLIAPPGEEDGVLVLDGEGGARVERLPAGYCIEVEGRPELGLLGMGFIIRRCR